MPYFTPPTHEEPMRTNQRPLNYYRLTHANSIVKINGTFVSIRTPMPELLVGLTESVDYFRGGYEYEISQELADELVSDGFPMPDQPDTGELGLVGYGRGGYGYGRYGL